MAFPFAASAATMPSIWPTGWWGPIVSCTGNYIPNSPQIPVNGSQPKPCTSLDDLVQTLLNALSLLMSIALFIIAPILVAVGGIMLMMGGANPEMLGRGKSILTGTVIGAVIILSSYLIISTVLTAFGVVQCFGGFGPGCATAGSSFIYPMKGLGETAFAAALFKNAIL